MSCAGKTFSAGIGEYIDKQHIHRRTITHFITITIVNTITITTTKIIIRFINLPMPVRLRRT